MLLGKNNLKTTLICISVIWIAFVSATTGVLLHIYERVYLCVKRRKNSSCYGNVTFAIWHCWFKYNKPSQEGDLLWRGPAVPSLWSLPWAGLALVLSRCQAHQGVKLAGSCSLFWGDNFSSESCPRFGSWWGSTIAMSKAVEKERAAWGWMGKGQDHGSSHSECLRLLHNLTAGSSASFLKAFSCMGTVGPSQLMDFTWVRTECTFSGRWDVASTSPAGACYVCTGPRIWSNRGMGAKRRASSLQMSPKTSNVCV